MNPVAKASILLHQSVLYGAWIGAPWATTYPSIDLSIFMCMYVCIYIYRDTERERGRDKESQHVYGDMQLLPLFQQLAQWDWTGVRRPVQVR